MAADAGAPRHGTPLVKVIVSGCGHALALAIAVAMTARSIDRMQAAAGWEAFSNGLIALIFAAAAVALVLVAGLGIALLDEQS